MLTMLGLLLDDVGRNQSEATWSWVEQEKKSNREERNIQPNLSSCGERNPGSAIVSPSDSINDIGRNIQDASSTHFRVFPGEGFFLLSPRGWAVCGVLSAEVSSQRPSSAAHAGREEREDEEQEEQEEKETDKPSAPGPTEQRQRNEPRKPAQSGWMSSTSPLSDLSTRPLLPRDHSSKNIVPFPYPSLTDQYVPSSASTRGGPTARNTSNTPSTHHPTLPRPPRQG